MTWISDQRSEGTEDGERLALLSAVLRHASDRGEPAELTSYTFDRLIDAANPPETPLDGVDRLILFIEESSSRPDAFIVIKANDYPRFYCRGPGEMNYYLKLAEQMGLIEMSSKGPGFACRLTIPGWKHVADLRKRVRRSDQAFVAMWFDPEMDDAWEQGIEKALKETGFRPLRIDRKEHNNKIDDEIVAEVKRSGLLIADFTGHRAGVYFEAGLAQGLGIPMIWTCRDDQIEEAHFDTRQYNHIVWSSPGELQERLVNRIRATIPTVSSDGAP